MLRWKDLGLLGTSHIAPASQRAVEQAFTRFKPGILALELDARRFAALWAGPQRPMRLADLRLVGVKGWLMAVFASWAERMLGRNVGTRPGDEMLRAARLARAAGIPIALIDQDVVRTLRRISETLTWRERLRFVGEALAGIVRRPQMPFRLERVPSERVLRKLLCQLRRAYPSIHQVLVVERNAVMARNLAHLVRQHPGTRILAVVGAGHAKELLQLVRQELRRKP
jgi:pheromone shutdown protein TraB